MNDKQMKVRIELSLQADKITEEMIQTCSAIHELPEITEHDIYSAKKKRWDMVRINKKGKKVKRGGELRKMLVLKPYEYTKCESTCVMTQQEYGTLEAQVFNLAMQLTAKNKRCQFRCTLSDVSTVATVDIIGNQGSIKQAYYNYHADNETKIRKYKDYIELFCKQQERCSDCFAYDCDNETCTIDLH